MHTIDAGSSTRSVASLNWVYQLFIRLSNERPLILLCYPGCTGPGLPQTRDTTRSPPAQDRSVTLALFKSM